MTLNETHLQAKIKVKLPGYISFSRNKTERASLGILTSVKEADSSNCVRVDEVKADNEFILTRHDQFETPVNILNLYGQQ